MNTIKKIATGTLLTAMTVGTGFNNEAKAQSTLTDKELSGLTVDISYGKGSGSVYLNDVLRKLNSDIQTMEGTVDKLGKQADMLEAALNNWELYHGLQVDSLRFANEVDKLTADAAKEKERGQSLLHQTDRRKDFRESVELYKEINKNLTLVQDSLRNEQDSIVLIKRALPVEPKTKKFIHQDTLAVWFDKKSISYMEEFEKLQDKQEAQHEIDSLNTEYVEWSTLVNRMTAYAHGIAELKMRSEELYDKAMTSNEAAKKLEDNAEEIQVLDPYLQEALAEYKKIIADLQAATFSDPSINLGRVETELMDDAIKKLGFDPLEPSND